MPKKSGVWSIDQKQVIIDLVRKGVSQSEVAELFKVSRSTIYRIVRRLETTSNLENLTKNERSSKNGHLNVCLLYTSDAADE